MVHAYKGPLDRFEMFRYSWDEWEAQGYQNMEDLYNSVVEMSAQYPIISNPQWTAKGYAFTFEVGGWKYYYLKTWFGTITLIKK